jgi:predicted ATPase
VVIESNGDDVVVMLIDGFQRLPSIFSTLVQFAAAASEQFTSALLPGLG